MTQDHGSLDALPPLREVIARHGLRAEKKLGQNFLLDANITDKIVRIAGDLSGSQVLEVGPGPGGLTRSLLRAGTARVTAIEYDCRAVAALRDLAAMADGRLDIHEADGLAFDYRSIPGPRWIIANLPYNIATPLLLGWLRAIREDADFVQGMALMFQREVADRITAPVGGKAYGRLAVICQWLCDVKRVFDIPGTAFVPPPKVISSVVLFRPKQRQVEAASFATVEKLTAAAFGQRRKMLRSSLAAFSAALESAGIDPTLRAEDVSVGDFLNIARAIKSDAFN